MASDSERSNTNALIRKRSNSSPGTGNVRRPGSRESASRVAAIRFQGVDEYYSPQSKTNVRRVANAEPQWTVGNSTKSGQRYFYDASGNLPSTWAVPAGYHYSRQYNTIVADDVADDTPTKKIVRHVLIFSVVLLFCFFLLFILCFAYFV